MKENPPQQSAQLQLSEARKTRQQPMWLEREARMQKRLKTYALVICLFVFWFVIIGGGLHLNPGAAFLAAVTGTPLVIHAFRSRSGQVPSPVSTPPDSARNQVLYVGSTTDKCE